MPLRLRRIIYFSFILLFFVVAPLLVLYSMGYRYHWGKRRFERTGLLTISGTPHDAVVTMDDAIRARRLPARIGGLPENEYTIRVEKPGFHPWEQRMAITSGRTTFADGIALFPDSPPTLTVSDAVTDVQVSGDRAWLAFVRTSTSFTEAWIMNLRNGRRDLVLRLPLTGRPSPPRISLAWAPRNASLLITTTGAGKSDVLLVQPERSLVPTSILAALGAFPQRMMWELGSSAVLVADIRGMLIRYHVATNRTTVLGIRTPRTPFGLARDTVYTVTARGDLTAHHMGKQETTTIATLPNGATVNAFTAWENETLTMSTTAGTTITVEIPNGDPIVSPGTRRTSVTTDDRRMRTVSHVGDHELWMNDGEHEPRLIVRRSAPLIGFAVHPTGRHVMVATATEIIAIELRTREPRATAVIATFDAISAIAITPTGDVLHIAGRRSTLEGLWALPLE
ncbi:PEGA domain-containing protein [Candidatus Uhrbacteria bacterium]|nr:PEGA domain-containing protein [Candidatus Uhrbacteria bacterium]